eukprot:COSAG02_NODE_4687_length_5092_cov_2.075506_4_plen_68_part_00
MRQRADWEVLATVEQQRADLRLLTTCILWSRSQGNESMKHQVPADKMYGRWVKQESQPRATKMPALE